jgi:hypothetical protein
VNYQDLIQALFELGSAVFGLLNIRAIRKSKKLEGVHWAPTAFFTIWGAWNIYFYWYIAYPLAWGAGIAITVVNAVWLGHVYYYWRKSCRH